MAQTLDQSYTTAPNNGWGLRYSTHQVGIGGAFVAGKSAKCSMVKVMLSKYNSPDGNVYIQLRADDPATGLPTSTVLAQSNNRPCSEITSSVVEYTFVFPNPAYLTAGVRYHYQILATYDISTTVFVLPNGTYTAGADFSPYQMEMMNSDGTFTTSNTAKVYFKEYYDTSKTTQLKKVMRKKNMLGIGVDATTSGRGGSTSLTTLTWSHTVGSQDDRILIVFVPISQPINVSSVTYNNVALTQYVGVTNGNPKAYIYFMVNPPSGAHNISITFNTSIQWLYAGATSFYGVNQTTPLANQKTQTGTGGNKTFTIASTYNTSVILECGGADSGVHIPQNEQVRVTFDNRISSYDINVVAGNNNKTWNCTTNTAYSYVACELRAALSQLSKFNKLAMTSNKKIIGVENA